MRPRSRLVNGPTAAMRRSAPGERGFPLSWATPPSSQSLMLSTWIPLRRARTACATSWASTEARNRMAAATAAYQVGDGASAGQDGGEAAGREAENQDHDDQNRTDVDLNPHASDSTKRQGRFQQLIIRPERMEWRPASERGYQAVPCTGCWHWRSEASLCFTAMGAEALWCSPRRVCRTSRKRWVPGRGAARGRRRSSALRGR